jgi:exonuclease SbcD
VSGLQQRGYDYWALGHIHRREVLSTEPPIIFPGNLQGRRLRETGPKGATMIELSHGHPVTFEHRVLDVVRWDLIEVDATGCAGRDDACERIATAVRQAARGAGDRLLAARIVITGRCEAHTALLADAERLRYDVVAGAADVAGGQVWIEGVRLDTSPPRELAHAGDDAVGELIQELAELTAGNGAMDELSAALAPLAKALPAGVVAGLDPADPGTVKALMAEVSQSLPAALLQKAA